MRVFSSRSSARGRSAHFRFIYPVIIPIALLWGSMGEQLGRWWSGYLVGVFLLFGFSLLSVALYTGQIFSMSMQMAVTFAVAVVLVVALRLACRGESQG